MTPFIDGTICGALAAIGILVVGWIVIQLAVIDAENKRKRNQWPY